MMTYDVVLLGGGVSGAMMAKRLELELPGLSSIILDKGNSVEHSFHLHRPIPELKPVWTKAPFYLGIWDGKMKSDISPKDINNYSLKITGKLSPSNIINFKDQAVSHIYPTTKTELLELLRTDNKLEGTVTKINLGAKILTLAGGEEIGYSYLVNTIPLPVFLGLAKVKSVLNFVNHPFYIATIPLGYDSKLYQMVYNTNSLDNTSRATLLGDTLFIDSSSPCLRESDINFIKEVFGVTARFNYTVHHIKIGRFDPLGVERKHLFYYLNRFGVFCLGRYGAWTFKVANDVWDDTKFLCSLIIDREYSNKGELLCKL